MLASVGSHRSEHLSDSEIDSFTVAHGARQVRISGPKSDSSFEVARHESKNEYDIAPEAFVGKWTIDIGAGYGEFAALAHLSGASRVLGFEPNPFVFPYLAKNLGGLPGIELSPYGVYSSAGPSELYFRPSGTASASIAQVQYDPNSEFAKTRISESIELVAIGDVLAEFIDSRGVLKIDAEGSEYEIVRQIFSLGFDSALENVVIEYHAGVRDLVELFAASDFMVRVVAKSESMGLVYASHQGE